MQFVLLHRRRATVTRCTVGDLSSVTFARARGPENVDVTSRIRFGGTSASKFESKMETKDSAEEDMGGGKDFVHGLCDLTCDNLMSIASCYDLIKLRSVCRSVKEKIENLSELLIHLSTEGLLQSTSEFFCRFKGKVSIASKQGMDPKDRWFSSLIMSIRSGFDLAALYNVKLKHSSLQFFCLAVREDLPLKIQKLTITYNGSINNFTDAYQTLMKLADNIEAKIELTYRRPRESLSDAVDQVLAMDGTFSFSTLSLR
jgi:hypothetical protein